MIGSMTSVPENLSSLEWKGSRPKRFEVGRRHVHPQDELDFKLQGKEESLRGKKHYQARYSSEVMNPYGSTKIFPDKYKRSDIFDIVELKKLINLPMTKLKFPNLQKGEHASGSLTKMQELKLGMRKHGIYRNFAKQRQASINKHESKQELPSLRQPLSQQI